MLKRIVFFTPTYLPTIGGEQIEINLLLTEIDKFLEKSKKYEFYFIAPNIISKKYCTFKNIQVHYLSINSKNRFNTFHNIIKLSRILSSIKPHLIHTFSIAGGGLMVYLVNLCRKRKYKYIISSPGSDLTVLKDIGYGARLNKINNFISKLIVKNEIFHQVPSKAMIRFCREINIPAEKIFVIPNGIPNEIGFHPSKNLVNELRKEYGIKNDNFVILSLSGFRKVKGVDYLIEGFIEACKKNRKLKLLLASRKTKSTDLFKAKIRQEGLEKNIHFIGLILDEKKEAFFEIADVFCMPSLFESFGIGLMEAMFRKKICITTDIGGMKDYMMNKVNGFLIKPKSSKSISEVIAYAYNNPEIHNKLKETAYKTATKYEIQYICPQFLTMYDDALKK